MKPHVASMLSQLYWHLIRTHLLNGAITRSIKCTTIYSANDWTQTGNPPVGGASLSRGLDKCTNCQQASVRVMASCGRVLQRDSSCVSINFFLLRICVEAWPQIPVANTNAKLVHNHSSHLTTVPDKGWSAERLHRFLQVLKYFCAAI